VAQEVLGRLAQHCAIPAAEERSDGASAIYQDKELMLAARALVFAITNSQIEPAYKQLFTEFIGALKTRT
jgi:hypothetical protein